MQPQPPPDWSPNEVSLFTPPSGPLVLTPPEELPDEEDELPDDEDELPVLPELVELDPLLELPLELDPLLLLPDELPELLDPLLELPLELDPLLLPDELPELLDPLLEPLLELDPPSSTSLAPFGVPTPVGPSHPGPALHMTSLHWPLGSLLPLVTSLKAPAFV